MINVAHSHMIRNSLMKKNHNVKKNAQKGRFKRTLEGSSWQLDNKADVAPSTTSLASEASRNRFVSSVQYSIRFIAGFGSFLMTLFL